ncbi:MAG: amino acid adenylation domain-containing protein [Erysipelotrichaceae bacterium]|nr:amino acid adenylation domain-containing protein [Erysipelotrichaceae bacterium]
MQTNVLDYLEHTVKRVPDKVAYANESDELTFRQVHDYARAIGTAVAHQGLMREPVVVYMQKHPKAIAAFFGVVYSGNFYVPIDEEMPKYRVELIFETLQPKYIIVDEVTIKHIETLDYQGEVRLFDDLIDTKIDENILAERYDSQLDIDPLYIVFTSGSTGIPKGVVACHRSVIDYIENLSQVLQVSEDTIFGNQAPLYFDACLKELYPTIKYGATAYLIPKQHFMFPIKLIEFLNEKKINTICWVASALSLVSGFRTFDTVIPQYLKTVAFGSEVFPIKQYKEWKRVLPDARFINLYGPTEATGMSCYYEVNKEFTLDEVIPIGKPFHNTGILLLKEDNTEAKGDEIGEICIRGTAVTLGYYHNPEKTAEAFVQNPLNTAYPETIYRTGDLAKYDDEGNLIFVSRKDHQIKHMGHRIELGEIELNINMIEGVTHACCIYDQASEKIVNYYVGDVAPRNIKKALKEKLPRYMIPNVVRQLEEMPMTPNGKIDRKALAASYKENRRK